MIVPTTPIPNIVPPVENAGYRGHPWRHDRSRVQLSSEQN